MCCNEFYDAEFEIGLIPFTSSSNPLDSSAIAEANTEKLNLALGAMKADGDFAFVDGRSGPLVYGIRFAAKEFLFKGTIQTSTGFGGAISGSGSRAYMYPSDQFSGAITRLTRIDGENGGAVIRLRGHGFKIENMHLSGRPYLTDATGEGPENALQISTYPGPGSSPGDDLPFVQTPVGIEVEGRAALATGGHIIRDCMIDECTYGICCRGGYYPESGSGTLTRTTSTTGTLAMSVADHGIATTHQVTLTWSGGQRLNVDTVVSGASIAISNGSGDMLPTTGTPIVVTFVNDENHADNGIVDGTLFWSCTSCFRSENLQAVNWKLSNIRVSGFGGAGFASTCIADVQRGGNIWIDGVDLTHSQATVFRTSYFSQNTNELSCANLKWDRFDGSSDYLTLFDYAGPIYSGDYMHWIKWKVRITGDIGNDLLGGTYDQTKFIVIPDGPALTQIERSDLLFDIGQLPVAGFQRSGGPGSPWLTPKPRALSIRTNSDSAGEIVTASGFREVDTESGASTDNLDRIVAKQATGDSPVTGAGFALAVGDILVVRAADSARTVVCKDGAANGNLRLAGDCTLDNVEDTLTLIYDGTNWQEIARSNNGT